MAVHRSLALARRLGLARGTRAQEAVGGDTHATHLAGKEMLLQNKEKKRTDQQHGRETGTSNYMSNKCFSSEFLSFNMKPVPTSSPESTSSTFLSPKFSLMGR